MESSRSNRVVHRFTMVLLFCSFSVLVSPSVPSPKVEPDFYQSFIVLHPVFQDADQVFLRISFSVI